MSSSYDRQQKSTTNVRRSNSSPSSVLRSTIRRQQPKNYDENDADDEYNRPIVNYNPNETYYDLYRRQQQQQQQINKNQKISLNRRSSFIHHRHSFHHPEDYIYDNNYDYYYEQQHRQQQQPDFINFSLIRWTLITTLTLISVKQITILLLKWIFLPIFTFLHYFYLLFYIIFNLFISLLQFYLMIMAFIVNYLGIDHYRSLLFGYLNLFRFWHYQQQQLLKNSNRHYPNELYLDSTIKRSISCGDNLDRQQQQPTTLNRYSKQSKKSFRNLSGTIPLKSNTGQSLSFWKSATKLSSSPSATGITTTDSSCPCCIRLDQERQRRQRSISLIYPSSSSNRQSSSSGVGGGSSSIRRHHSQSRSCHQHHNNGHCNHPNHHQQHHVNHQRHDLFDPLNITKPTMLNILIKPIIQTIFDWTQLTTIFSLIWKMKRRIRKLFRWCPTSTEELDEAEDKVLSCKMIFHVFNLKIELTNCFLFSLFFQILNVIIKLIMLILVAVGI